MPSLHVDTLAPRDSTESSAPSEEWVVPSEEWVVPSEEAAGDAVGSLEGLGRSDSGIDAYKDDGLDGS